VQIIRIKDEIKFLHKKKDKLNQDLYYVHLKAAKEWGRLWDVILPSINYTLNLGMEKKYKQLDLKISKLVAAQAEKPRIKTLFYPRVINNSDITFTDEKLILLNKGLKYNLNYKNKNRLSTVAMEAETAISMLPSHEQEYLRYQVAHNLQKLYKQQGNKHTRKDHAKENKTFTQIKRKLEAANAMVTKADKGNSLIILPESEYNSKVNDFITNNNFSLIPQDNTKRLQRTVRATVNECKNIILKDSKWRHISLNPTAPRIRGLIKIHKTDTPIRPIVNWNNAPTYKLTKYLVKTLQTYAPLPFAFNIKNTVQLISDLKNIPVDRD
jgi:hypothetical protein